MNYVLCIALGLFVGFLAGCAFKVWSCGDKDAWSEGYDTGYKDGLRYGKGVKETIGL